MRATAIGNERTGRRAAHRQAASSGRRVGEIASRFGSRVRQLGKPSPDSSRREAARLAERLVSRPTALATRLLSAGQSGRFLAMIISCVQLLGASERAPPLTSLPNWRNIHLNRIHQPSGGQFVVSHGHVPVRAMPVIADASPMRRLDRLRAGFVCRLQHTELELTSRALRAHSWPSS